MQARRALATVARWWRPTATALLLLGIVGSILTMPSPWLRRAPLEAAQVEAGIPEAWRPLVGSIEAWRAATPAKREAFLRWLVDVGLEVQRQKASEVIRAQHEARMTHASAITGKLFTVLAWLSLLVLLLPFFVSRARAPRRRTLWLHTALATATLLLSWLLLLGCVTLLLQVTGTASALANPEQGLLDAGFGKIRTDVHAGLTATAARAAPADPTPYGPLVGAADADTAGGYVTNILRSLQYFDPESLKPAVAWSQRAWALFSYVPLVVPFVVVLVVLLTMRTTILQIVHMPVAAARGEKGSGRRALGHALKFIGLELLAILGLIAVLIPAGIMTSLAVRRLSHHMIGVILAQTRTTVVYFGELGTPPEQTPLTFGLLAVPAFLALATLLSAGGLTLFALRARRLLQQRFHFGWPLRREERLWRRSFMAMLRLQWIPVLLLWVVTPGLIGLHAGVAADAADALHRMTTTGARLAVALPIALVLFGGFGALVTLWPLRRLLPAARGAYTLRARDADDEAFLREAHHEGLRDAVEATWGPWDEAAQDGFVDAWLATASPRIVLVDGKPAGYLEVEEHETRVTVVNVVLVPAVQRRGIGTRILQDIIESATAKRLPVYLQVMRGNPARALYERLGFRRIGETDGHIQMLRPLPPVP